MLDYKVAIVPNADGIGAHAVLVDGRDITDGIATVRVDLEGGEAPCVELGLAVIEVERMEFETPHLHIPDTTRDALIALGWVPPGIAEKVRDLREVQGKRGTWNHDQYMHGLYNGIELALSILEGERDPQFKAAPTEDGYLIERSTSDLSGSEYAPIVDGTEERDEAESASDE